MSSKSNKLMIWKFMALLVILQLALPIKTLSGQQEPSTEGLSYKQGRIRTTDGYEIKFSSLTIGRNEMTYVEQGARERTRTYRSRRYDATETSTVVDTLSINIDRVIRLEVESGSKAAEMGLGFFVASALGSALGLADIGGNESLPEPSMETKLAIGAGITLGMTLIGMVWGSTIKEYKTVWTNPAFGNQPKTGFLHMINRGNNILLYAGFNF